MKTCNKCGINREEKDFYRRKDAKSGRMNSCRFCVKTRFREWFKKRDPRKTKNDNLKAKYKISLDDYEAMLEKQGYFCAICRTAEDVDNIFCVDHCHRTGKVRGILCARCNKGIGHFRDSYAIVERGARYLRKFYE